MKFLGKLLVVLGGLFVVLLVGFAFLVTSAGSFRQQHEPFVVKFTLAFSQHWDLAQVQEHLSNEMLAQALSPNGGQAISLFRSLGPLNEISDFELLNYYSGTEGETGVFRFRGVFESGKGLVTVTIIDKDKVLRVMGFNINVTAQSEIKNPERGA